MNTHKHENFTDEDKTEWRSGYPEVSGWYEVRARSNYHDETPRVPMRRWFDVNAKTWSLPVAVGITPDNQVAYAQTGIASLGKGRPDFFEYRGLRYNPRAYLPRS